MRTLVCKIIGRLGACSRSVVFGVALHYGGEVHWSWILEGNLKFDRPRVTLLSGGGLQYIQESFGGEPCTWMKKWHGCQRGEIFLKGSSPEVKFLGQSQSLGQETCPPENSNLNKIVYYISFHLLRHTIPGLKQPCLGLKFLTNWWTSPL